MAVWDNLAPFPDDPNVGAYHGSDLAMVFGTFVDSGTATETERQLSVRYMDAWLTFSEVSFLFC